MTSRVGGAAAANRPLKEKVNAMKLVKTRGKIKASIEYNNRSFFVVADDVTETCARSHVRSRMAFFASSCRDPR